MSAAFVRLLTAVSAILVGRGDSNTAELLNTAGRFLTEFGDSNAAFDELTAEVEAMVSSNHTPTSDEVNTVINRRVALAAEIANVVVVPEQVDAKPKPKSKAKAKAKAAESE